MRLNKILLTILLVGVVSFSCIEEFTPEKGSYEDRLFIEAFISGEPDMPHHVIIARTKPVNYRVPKIVYSPKYPPPTPAPENLSGADVRVYCNDGTVSYFVETVQGIYSDPHKELILEEGKKYRLYVQTLDKSVFESLYEEFKPAPPIDSISYSVLEARETETSQVSLGYQFHVNANNLNNEPLFIRYTMRETFIYEVPYKSNFIWDGKRRNVFSNQDSMLCYKTQDVPGIFLSSTQGLADNTFRNANIHYVSQNGDELSIRYSLLVYQMSINRSAYSFWEELNTLLFKTGGLYETQPFRISGNIYCTSDPSLSITGVFEVAGVTKLRKFVSRPREFPIYPQFCYQDTVGTLAYPWDMVPPGSYISYTNNVYLTALSTCYICSARGGTVKRPSFWSYY